MLWTYKNKVRISSTCVCSLSPVQLFSDPMAPLSFGFPRQEYWSGLTFLPPVSCIGRQVLYHWASWEALSSIQYTPNLTLGGGATIENKFICKSTFTMKLNSVFESYFKKQPNIGLPWWLSDKESACQCRRHRFDPWSGKIPHAMEQLSPCATTTEPVL